MTRARWISLLLLGGMMLSSAGCCWHRPCWREAVFPLFPRWRAWRDCREGCHDCGTVVTGAVSSAPCHTVSAPVIMTSPPVISTTTPPPVINAPAQQAPVGPAPRVVPVPQTAAPIQYTP